MNGTSRMRIAASSRASRGRRPRLAGPALLILGAAALAACSKDASGPSGLSVATVTVEAPATTVEVGGLLQLTATARDADGNVVTGQHTDWSSTNPAFATVSSNGLVNGLVEGTVTISAVIGGKTGSAQITVTSPGAVFIESISPATLVPGQTATLTGYGFSTVPSANAVSIGSYAATVLSATSSSLMITVPSSLCLPAGPVNVTVTVAGRVSNTVSQPMQASGTTVTAAVGQMQYLQSGFCLQFGASASSEQYLIGVQNYSQDVTLVTPVTVAMEVPSAAPPLTAPPPLPVLGSAATGVLPIDPARNLRWARHREAELALRRREQSPSMPPMVLAKSSIHSGLVPASADVALAVPGVVNVGDLVTIRVPNINGNLCTDYTEITTVAKAVGTKSVWLEDTGNPAGGFTTSDYQNLANLFDTRIYASDVDYFGTPSDIDGNGRIVIVLTKEINKTQVLGFTTNADLRPRSAGCPASDEGEVYYSRAPDPNGTVGEAYTTADALKDAPKLLAHEVTHLIQFSVRSGQPDWNGTQLTIWELEGQATFAEEVAGHAVTGRTTGQNYGFAVAWDCVPGFQSCTDPRGTDWYDGGFVDLFLYFGFNVTGPNPVVGAPEQCSWLDLSSNGNTGPCYSGREVYGVPWMLLRYLSDRFGPAVGGEKQLQHRLILGNLSGFANVANAIGQPGQSLDRVLADWAAALYIDDRVPGADPALTIPSWNLRDIESRVVQAAHLRPYDHEFAAFSDDVQARAGSTAYFRVTGTHGAALLRVVGTGGGVLPTNMRVFIVRVQ